MSHWHEGRMAVCDLETTGPDPQTARTVTACVALVGGGYETHARDWLIDPGIDIPEGATAVHGITTEQARTDGLQPLQALPEIAAALTDAWSLGIPVVAYNAPYDFTVLDRDLRRHDHDGFPITGPVIDPFVLDRQVDKYRRGSRTLTAACAHYRVALDGAHDATADAVAAARVAWRIACLYPQIAAMTLGELHAAQARWHAERQADFAAYLRRTGKPAGDVCGHWPQRPPVAAS